VQAAQDSTAGRAQGQPAAPKAGDLGAGALKGEPEVRLAEDAKPKGEEGQGEAGLAAGRPPEGAKPTGESLQHRADITDLNPQQREQQQAIEAQLRRVPDDPAGLLRQRFLLQQLRREGRLP
jgi:Ca-activated chloride channel family protein